MLKDRALFTMYQHICIWKYYDMVVSRVGINCSQPKLTMIAKRGVIVIAESLCFDEIGNSKVV